MAGRPDPKPVARTEDPKARRRFRFAGDECEAWGCGKSDVPLSVHHVLYGDDGRDDVAGNFLLLCGDGVQGCHGLFHAADEETRRRIGKTIKLRRRDVVEYVIARLGSEEAGLDYIRRRYLVDPTAPAESAA